jgi:hypothetical protein
MTTGISFKTAFLAGGLGARCAPNGEREGQSPLAILMCANTRKREGQSPLAWFQKGSARGKAHSHERA